MKNTFTAENRIALKKKKSNKGQYVYTEYFEKHNGQWHHAKVCPQASIFGLGDCDCNNHPAVRRNVIDSDSVIEMLLDMLDHDKETIRLLEAKCRR